MLGYDPYVGRFLSFPVMIHRDLVDPATLRAHLQREDWIVFDVRHDLLRPEAGAQAWAEGHIPGSLHLDLEEVLSGAKSGSNGRHPLPDRQELVRHLGALGVGSTTQVVACDAQGGMFAARLWWLLRWLGHEAVAVLDGGIPAWIQEGGEISTDTPMSRAPAVLEVRSSLVPSVSVSEVQDALDDRSALVVDARSPDRFRGENETIDPVGGHIPGAVNRFFRDNLSADGRFKDPAVLRAEFALLLGGRPPEQAIMQCGSGVTACHNLLALELAGLPGASLYPGSWSEWCSDPARPVAR